MTPRKSLNGLACWRRRAMFGAAFVLVAGSMVAKSSESWADGIKRGGMLIMARPDEPLTFDPFIQLLSPLSTRTCV